MAATTTLLGLVTPTQGTLTGTWGDTVNYGITEYLDIAIAGTLTLTGDGTVILANTTGSSSGTNITSTLSGPGTVTAQFAIVKVSGTTGVKIVQAPSFSRTYLVVNASSFAVTFKPSSASGVSIAAGETASVYYNGADYVKVVGTATAGAAGGSNTQVQYNNSGVLAGITGATSNGTALTLVAPNLGSPFSVGTMPAFTLGGTIAGGGNQINNVVIGTTTPLAGAFTTLSATGAITGTTIALSGQTADITNATLALLTLKTTDNGGLSAVKLDGKTGGAAVQAWIVGLNRSGTAGTFDIEDATASTFALTITRATLAAKFGGTLSGGTSGTAYSFSGSAPATSLTLDSSGNLGIGTSSPAQTLHVKTSTSVTPITLGVLSNATGLPALSFNGAYASTTMAGIYANGGTSTSLYYEVPSGNSHFFGIADSTKMTLDSAGNLGLGVTPVNAYTTFGYKNYELPLAAFASFDVGLRPILQLKSNVYYNSGGSTKYITSGHATQYAQDSGEHIWSTAASGTANNAVSFTTAMTLDASGNLGIGTSSPSGKLHVAGGASNVQIYLSNNSYSTYYYQNTGGTSGVSFPASQAYIWDAGGTERARIDSSGNLLVGVATANANGGVLQLKSGITFPATPVAATDANTLDDYEEGTWSASTIASVNITGASFSEGRYTKIGNIVHVQGRFTLTVTLPNTLTYALMTLPFTPLFTTAGSLIDNVSLVAGTAQAASNGSAYAFFAATALLPAGATDWYVAYEYQV